MRHARIVLLIATLTAAPASAAPAGRFETLRLSVDGDVIALVPADLDGDDRLDLLAVYRTGLPPHQKRFFAVFWNQGRRFSARPDLIIPIDDRATCVFDVAEVDGQKGWEILSVTPAGVNALSLRGRKLGSPVALVGTATLFHRPAPGELPRLPVAQQLGAPGPADLLLPALGALEIYRRSGAGYARLARLELATESRARAGGARRGRGLPTLGPLSVSHSFPAIAVADTNGDGRKDLVASMEDRLEIFAQREDRGFAEKPTLRREFAVRTAAELTDMSSGAGITVTDVDGDGVADVVVRKQVSRGITSAATTSFIYFGRKGGGYPDKPDQVMRSEGASGTEVELFDATGDGRTDLVVPSVNIGVIAIIRVLTTKTLKVNFQVFPFEPAAHHFAERPAAERELKFKVSLSGEAGVQAVDMRGDYNGDGKPDLAFGTDDDELSIFPGTGGKTLFADDAVEEIAIPAFGTLEAVDLDRQGKSDMVLYYPTTKGRRNQLAVLINRGPW